MRHPRFNPQHPPKIMHKKYEKETLFHSPLLESLHHISLDRVKHFPLTYFGAKLKTKSILSSLFNLIPITFMLIESQLASYLV